MSDIQFEKTFFSKEKKPASIVDKKTPNPVENWGEKLTDWSMKNLLTKCKLRKKTDLQKRKVGYLCPCFFILSAGDLLIAFLFGNLGKQSHQKLSYWRCTISQKRGGCWLIGVVFMEGTE